MTWTSEEMRTACISHLQRFGAIDGTIVTERGAKRQSVNELDLIDHETIDLELRERVAAYFDP